MSRPQRSPRAKHWSLDSDCVFLNHGSFGATPNEIREEQRRWQDLLEDEPVRFYEDLAMDFMKTTRESLAKMLQCGAEDLALVENATTGVNTILRSLEFNAGDEILVPDHAYQACRNARLTSLPNAGVQKSSQSRFHFQLKGLIVALDSHHGRRQ